MNVQSHSAKLLGGLICAFTLGAAIFSLNHDLSVEYVFMGLAVCAAAVYIAARAPQLFLVAVIFVPQWKAYWPLSSVDRVVDLTLLTLIGLGACLVWRLLAHLGRLDPLGLSHLFLGQSKVILTYLLFAAVVAASYTYTSAPEYGASKLFRFLGIGSLLLLSPLFLIRSDRDFRSFARAFVVFAGVTVVQLVGGLETVTGGQEDATRIGAGWLIGMAAIIVMFYPLFESPRTQQLFLVSALPILVVGLIASVARGPMVALFVVLLIRVFLWFKEGHRGTAMALGALFVVSGLGAFYVLRSAGGNKYTNKAKELVRLAEGDMTKGSATMRISFYEAALPAIPEHPLLGRGIGSWSVFYFGRDERGYPHNIFVEVAFEEGLVGLAAIVFFLGALYGELGWLRSQTGNRYLVLGILLFYCLLVAMFSGDLDDNRLLWFWAGMLMALSRTVRLEHLQRAAYAAPARVVSRLFVRPSWLQS